LFGFVLDLNLELKLLLEKAIFKTQPHVPKIPAGLFLSSPSGSVISSPQRLQPDYLSLADPLCQSASAYVAPPDPVSPDPLHLDLRCGTVPTPSPLAPSSSSSRQASKTEASKIPHPPHHAVSQQI
jgi:hypothetical protein